MKYRVGDVDVWEHRERIVQLPDGCLIYKHTGGYYYRKHKDEIYGTKISEQEYHRLKRQLIISKL